MNYYDQIRYLAKVDNKDNVIGKTERWKAHKEGILHRGFTVMIVADGKLVLQHRKHPVFDGWFDLGCSSHPIFKNGKIQNNKDAVQEALQREWDIRIVNHSSIFHKGFVIYKAQDQYSEYQEHELCHLYQVRISENIRPNYKYMYGFSMIKRDLVLNRKSPLKKVLAPWVLELSSLF